MFCSRLQSVVQKSFGQPQLTTVNGNFTTFFYLWTVDHGGLVLISHSNVWCNSLALLSSFMEWQHLVGVVQRNQPCLHGHPMCGIVESFGFVPFYHFEVTQLATVSLRVPFLFPLIPICFSPLLPTCIQLPEEQVAHTVLCFMSRLGSFFMLCNKRLLLSSVVSVYFINFLVH